MKQRFTKLVLVLFVAATFLVVGVSDLFARRGGGGSRSFSRPRTTKSVPKTTSKPKSSTSSKPTTSKRTTTTPKRTAAQQKSYEAAKKNGTAYKSKAEATAAFKKANASKYISKYTKEPATRPSHIPQTTTVGGTSYNVMYNQGMGCYGYTNSLGAFIMYDAMADAAMMSTLMRSNNYYYDTAPLATPHVHRSLRVGVILVEVLFVVGLILALVIINK